jgi:aristolochene synthase
MFNIQELTVEISLLSGIMRFCARLYMTPEELTLIRRAEENCMKHITFVNDICSYNKEVLTAKKGSQLGAICSSVPIVMELHQVDEHEAKNIMWKVVREWELRHFELVKEISGKSQSQALAAYLRGLEYQAAGNERWSLLTPRYYGIESLAFSEGP